MTGRVEPLRADHDRTAFACGEPALDTWLREQAGQAARKGGARTYVVREGARVVGYYAICAFSVEARRAPARARIGRLDVPAILLARLAVDRTAQGRGLGGRLLADALLRSVRVSGQLGAGLVVVHALHEAAAGFYARHGFLPLDDENPLTLYVRIHDLRGTCLAASD